MPANAPTCFLLQVLEKCLGSPVSYLACHEIDAERRNLFFSFREVRAAGSPAGGSRHRSAYTSVGPPIPLGPQACAPAAADIPAASVGKTETTASTGQKQPEAAVQHRLGKATPLKKSFTPRPSRFRLEAERLSVTPPDKSSGLEKVLFRSPVKADRHPEQLQGKDKDVHVSCAGSGLVHDAAQPMEESCHAVKADEAQPSDMLVAERGNECSMVTPANQLQNGVLHAPRGVFADMQVILDPELTAEESSRYVIEPPGPVFLNCNLPNLLLSGPLQAPLCRAEHSAICCQAVEYMQTLCVATMGHALLITSEFASRIPYSLWQQR